MARLLLLRHAESEWNAQGRWQGWADPPLTAHGVRQAEEAAAKLRAEGLTAVVASDLQRARRTAAVAAQALGIEDPVHIEPGLREYDVGVWSGLSRPEIQSRWPGELDDWRHGRSHSTPGGEAYEGFVARILGALRRTAQTFADHRTLVVTHGGVIGAIERQLGSAIRRHPHLSGRWLEVEEHEVRCGAEVDLLDARPNTPRTQRDALGETNEADDLPR